MNQGSALDSFCRLGLTAFNFFIIGVLWFLTVILGLGLTVGAATSAAYVAVTKLKTDTQDSGISTYFKALIKNFIPATVIWIVILLIQQVAVFNLMNIQLFGEMKFIAMAAHVFIMFELLLLGLFIFPMIGRYNNTLKGYITTSLQLIHGHLLKTLVILIMLGVVLFVIFKVQHTFVFVMVPVFFYSTETVFSDIFRLYE